MRQVGQVTEAHTEEQEAEGAERHALQVTPRLIGEDRDGRDRAHRQGRQRQEPGERGAGNGGGEGERNDSQRHGEVHEPVPKQAGGPGELAVAEQAEDADRADHPCRAEEDRPHRDHRQHDP